MRFPSRHIVRIDLEAVDVRDDLVDQFVAAGGEQLLALHPVARVKSSHLWRYHLNQGLSVFVVHLFNPYRMLQLNFVLDSRGFRRSAIRSAVRLGGGQARFRYRHGLAVIQALVLLENMHWQPQRPSRACG